MRHLKANRLISGLVALSAVLAAHLLFPQPAQASKALFRVQRGFFGVFAPVTVDFEPATQGPNKAPPATAYVFNAAKQFVLPKAFISYMSIYYCPPGQCFPGYPVSGGYYSYFNGQGRFAAAPSMGAPGPSATSTAVFPTTMGNNLPWGGVPNYGSGAPVTPTTTFSGRYDFQRAGSIRITPGPNKFSGTMRLIFGPNASFYQKITVNTPFTSRGYGSFTAPPSTDPTNVGEFTSSGSVMRYRMTALLSNKACITSPPGTPMTRPPCGAGNYISAQAHYLHLLAPWTTGMAEAYQPLGTYLTNQTMTGYDNMSPAMTGMNKIGADYATRVVSLVRPRLTHTFLNTAFPATIDNNFEAARMWTMKVFFLPEPGEIALLAAGIAGLAGLARLRNLRKR